MTTYRTCARGCTVARRHLAACPDQDACRGCQPREAEHGYLCYGCHRRLLNLLESATGQSDLLRLMAGLKGEVEMTAVTIARLGTGWRTESDQRWDMLYAKGGVVGAESAEPIRLACIDAEREIEDRIALWVVHLVNDYAMTDVEAGVDAGARFLVQQLERLEWREAIGDELEAFMEIMSQAHPLAPWREQVARLRGIPCPECQATTLVMFGGDSDVTCIRHACRATMSHERYGIWTRMLADEQRGAG